MAPATEALRFATADPYTVEAERFAAAVLDGPPTPTPPEDAVANLRVIERILAAADSAGSASQQAAPAALRSTATTGSRLSCADDVPSGSRA